MPRRDQCSIFIRLRASIGVNLPYWYRKFTVSRLTSIPHYSTLSREKIAIMYLLRFVYLLPITSHTSSELFLETDSCPVSTFISCFQNHSYGKHVWIGIVCSGCIGGGENAVFFSLTSWEQAQVVWNLHVIVGIVVHTCVCMSCACIFFFTLPPFPSFPLLLLSLSPSLPSSPSNFPSLPPCMHV